MTFFFEVLIGGLLSGIMYSLVALGFVLIYKASSVFNFAQGAMVFFAVLSFVGFMELGLSFWAALPVTIGLDHRFVDGYQAATMSHAFRGYLADPASFDPVPVTRKSRPRNGTRSARSRG
jgi:branched-subunit amino acid ABC-type transport system permease component